MLISALTSIIQTILKNQPFSCTKYKESLVDTVVDFFFQFKHSKISIGICFSKEFVSSYSQAHVMNHTTMQPGRNKTMLGRVPETIHTRSSSIELQSFLTLKVVVPQSLVVWTVSGSTLVILVMNSSKYLQDFSKCVVLIIIWTSQKITSICNSHLIIHPRKIAQ